MSESMVERVAIAIAAAYLDDPADPVFDFYALTEEIKDRYYAMARAAIEAMREPTKEMLSDGELSIGGLPATLAVWEAMIDAALKD